MSKKIKIFVLPLVFSGHVNPICGVVYELCQMPDVECIIYGVAEYKEVMVRTGAEFRLYAHRQSVGLTASRMTKEYRNKFMDYSSRLIVEASYLIVPQILKDVMTDKPDLVFFDSNFPIGRYITGALRERKVNVKIAEFYPNFVFSKKMIKKNPETFEIDASLVLLGIVMAFRIFKMSWKLDVPFYNPLKIEFRDMDRLKIVAVFPELHPDLEDYDETFKFVGQCVAEEARELEKSEEDVEMKSILEKFPIKENSSAINDDGSILILMSLGTIFHDDDRVFEQLIQDVHNFDNQPNRQFRSSQFYIIVSTGSSSLKRLNEKIASGKLTLPNNMILRAHVPQLEILKRADLFITHNGQNSTSEAIKYGVPMVGLPVFGDQPIVAKRVLDELFLGIRLDPIKLKENELGDAINKVLSEPKYRKNIDEMSRISAKYNGRRDGAQLLIDFVKNNNLIGNANSNQVKSNQVQPIQ